MNENPKGQGTSREPAAVFSVFTEEEKTFVLPRKMGDRVLAFILSCALIAFFALQFARLEAESATGWLRKCLQALGIEVMFTFGIFSIISLIWVLFTPRWLESILQRRVRKVLTMVGAALAATVLTALYYIGRAHIK